MKVPFSIVKQGCFLAPTLFDIFFIKLLNYVFGTFMERVYLLTRSDGDLFNLSLIKTNANVRKTLIREMLFDDNVKVATHTPRTKCKR